MPEKQSIDKTGSFRFSDHDNPSQIELLSVSFDQPWLAEELTDRLAGKTLSVLKIKEFVLTDTPCYLFKAALKSLEVGKDKKLTVVSAPNNRRPGTYRDTMLDWVKLRFGQSLF